MDIFIAGCAKTRTTLIQWLFAGFKNCVIFPGECSYDVFRCSGLHYNHPNINLVAKRTMDSILTSKIYIENFKDQISRIKLDHVKLIYVRRNKKDTLKSDNGYVTEERYEVCEAQAEMLKTLIDFTIDSDEMLKNPDKMQQELAEATGLVIKNKWSTWPDFAIKDQMFYIKYPKIFNKLR